ncbi:MAG: hypothetical protein J7L04_11860 [Bacteroidales bacterium]|nr:hypothetical protein [Bacteroidales bacterium]
MIPAIVCEAEILSQITTIQALGLLDIPVIAISNDKQAIGLLSKYPVKKIVSPMPCYDLSFIDFLINTTDRGVLFYGSDANAELISRNKSVLINHGFFINISDINSQIGLYDKYELFKNSKTVGIKTPKSMLIDTEDDLSNVSEHFSFPFLVKPTKGAGGLYHLVENNYDELKEKYHELKKMINSAKYQHNDSKIIVQEFVDIQKPVLWNYNALYSEGIPLAEFTGIRIRSSIKANGCLKSTLLYGSSQTNYELSELNQIVLRHLKYQGIIETEWIYDQETGKYILFDANTRPSGNIRWVIKSGINIPYLYYMNCLGQSYFSKNVQKNGVTYHKLFWIETDLVEGIQGRKNKVKAISSVVTCTLTALFTPWQRAIDVFDCHDLRPTFILIKRLNRKIKLLIKKIIKNWLCR